MQYGPIPTNIFERVALWSGKVPVPLMDVLFSILKARGLMAAVSLCLFDALAGVPKSSEDLSRELKLDEPSLRLLLRGLVAAGYLRRSGNRFTLSKLSK